MSRIFYGCSSLISLPDISKWNTNNLIYKGGLFGGCSSLISLPDISKWNTNNVINMSFMFYGCSSLNSLPDLSKWNTNNVTDLRNMFSMMSFNIDKLKMFDNSLYQNLNLNEFLLNNMGVIYSFVNLFSKSNNMPLFNFILNSSLEYFPDISGWNTANVTDMSGIFLELF